ncbi:MAG: Holliday junction resolvase RuvX [Patescibacteria group bacterium]
MGIDYGEKRIGIALSDENASFAFAHNVLENNKNVIRKIKKICKENNVRKIILGESIDYNGRPNPIMEKIEKFKILLKKETNLPIEYQTEILTTQEARHFQKRSKKIDASAAALILRSFIEKKKMLK